MCSENNEVYEQLLNITFGLTTFSEKYLSDKTGCYGPCKRTEFDAKLFAQEHEIATEENAGIIQVTLMYASSAYEVRVKNFFSKSNNFITLKFFAEAVHRV